MKRRSFLVTGLAAWIGFGPSPGHALTTDEARALVQATIDDILGLVAANQSKAETAAALRKIIVARTAVDYIARFAAGRAWRTMSETQQSRFVDAFIDSVANEYAGHFRRFEGEAGDLRKFVRIAGAEDAGRKGVLVRTNILPTGETAISVDWLVSDRSGRVAVSDLVVEGISMAITQREIIGGMLDVRDGDVEQLIADLIARGEVSGD